MVRHVGSGLFGEDQRGRHSRRPAARSSRGALDFGGAVRSGFGALRTALAGRGPTLVVAADTRDGMPAGADEAVAGDGAAAVLVGDDSDGPVLAEYLGGASRTLEVTERWRTPGSDRSRAWEQRFGAHVFGPAALATWQAALVASGAGRHRRNRPPGSHRSQQPGRGFGPEGHRRQGRQPCRSPHRHGGQHGNRPSGAAAVLGLGARRPGRDDRGWWRWPTGWR